MTEFRTKYKSGALLLYQPSQLEDVT